MADNFSEKLSVIVVGAGIAGLATAWKISRTAETAGQSVEIKILEAKSRHGGATRTDIIDGYVCEWGPNGFLDNEPATLELVKSLGLEHDLVKADKAASRRYIYHTGRMREAPMSPPAFLKSDILSFPAKIRMGLEYFIRAKKDDSDETIESFGRRRLGRGFTKYLLDPMISGIFAGNISEMSLKAVFPKMVEMEREYGGLFKAMIAKGREAREKRTKTGGPAGPNAVLHTFRKGMGQLTDELSVRMESSLVLDTDVRSISRQGSRFTVHLDGKTLTADVVVLAIPSYRAAEAIAELSPETAKALLGIRYAPVVVICHGYSDAQISDPLNGFGVLIPRCEGIRSLGTLWSDRIFPGQAPNGRRLMRTIIGGAHDYGLVNESLGEVERIAGIDTRKVMGISGEPLFRQVYRHPQGIAQYNKGHLERLEKIERLERELPGLFFTGASYRGVSVNGTAKDACRVAELVFKVR